MGHRRRAHAPLGEERGRRVAERGHEAEVGGDALLGALLKTHDVGRRGDNERGRVDASPGHMCRKSVMVSLVLPFHRGSRFIVLRVVRRRKYKQDEDARRVSLVSANARRDYNFAKKRA